VVRGRNEGSLYQRSSDGVWVGAVSLPNGKRRVVYGRTQREARDKLRQLQRHVDDGYPVHSGRAMTVGQYLEYWLTVVLPARVAAGHMRRTTLDSYDAVVRQNILPTLGKLPLARLSPTHVREWLSELGLRTSARGRPLSARTVAYSHAVLRSALSDAARDELVTRNVATLVKAPRTRGHQVNPLTPDEAKAVLVASADDRLRTLWIVLLALGLRRGEALGLRWSDVDFDEGVVHIRRSLQRVLGDSDPHSGKRSWRLVETAPKTTGSVAALAMPRLVVETLIEHRQRQVEERLGAKVWVDPDLVYTTPIGTPLDPQNVSHAWVALCGRAGIRRVRLHDLRHSAASFMVAAGVDIKVIQSVLRHSRLATTADIYAHVLAHVQRDAADRIDGVLRGLLR
jgi:integrase